MDAGRIAAGSDPTRSVPAGLLRTPVFALTTVTLGVGAHVIGGEGLPGLSTVAFLTVVTGLLWSALSRSAEQSLVRLVLAVGGVQVALHVALLGHPHATGHAGHGVPGGAGPGAVMWVAHAVAVLALAWWLRRGERAFWAAASRVLRRLRRLGGPTRPVLGFSRPMPPAAAGSGLRPVLFVLTAPRRGPPLTA